MAAVLMLTIVAAILIAVQVPSHCQSQQSVYCEADHMCTMSEFCYQTGFCTKCIECERYRREPASATSCAKIPSSCGPCLPGYQEEFLADHKTRDLCQIMAPTTAQPSASSHKNIYYILSGLIGLCLVIFGVYCCCKKSRFIAERLKGLRSVPGGDVEEANVPLPPPPYSERGRLMPTAPPVIDHGSPSPSGSFCINIDQPAQQCTAQKAVPFHRPQAPYYINTDDEDSEADIDEASNGVHSPTPAEHEHDEDTMPSSWVPSIPADTTADSGISDQSTSSSTVAVDECCSSPAQGTTLSFAGRLEPRPSSPDVPVSVKRQRLDDSGSHSLTDESEQAVNVAIIVESSVNIFINQRR